MDSLPYVIVKSSRCYYGGEGARRFTRKPLSFNTILEAAQFAVDDGNPVGFDVYEYESTKKPIQFRKPILAWRNFPAFFLGIQEAEKESS